MPSSVFMYTEKRFWPVIESMLRIKLILASTPCRRSRQRHLNIISYYIANHCSWDYWHLISFQWFCWVGYVQVEKMKKSKKRKKKKKCTKQILMAKCSTHTCKGQRMYRLKCINSEDNSKLKILLMLLRYWYKFVPPPPMKKKRPPTSAQTLFNVLEIIFLLKVTLILKRAN